MDWSWLTGIFSSLWNILKRIVRLKWSDIWVGLQDLIQRLKSWYRWYQQNVQKPMQAARQQFRRLYDRFVLPFVKMVDLIRRITGLVGLFNKRLAAKLNLVFLNIETKMLLPLNLYTQRLNQLLGVFNGFLTPLGYFDRATLDNSIWRDVRQIKEIFRNPLGGTIANQPAPALASPSDVAKNVTDYLSGLPSPISQSADASVLTVQQDLAS